MWIQQFKDSEQKWNGSFSKELCHSANASMVVSQKVCKHKSLERNKCLSLISETHMINDFESLRYYYFDFCH